MKPSAFKSFLMIMFVATVAMIAIGALSSCNPSVNKGYNYKTHAKKGKKVSYRGDLTNFKCAKTRSKSRRR